MTVEIGGNTQTYIIALAWETLHHGKRRSQPALVLERGSYTEHLDCHIDILLRTTSQPSAQMSCFHSTRTTTAEHDKTLFGEALAQEHHLLIHRIGAQQGMTAHDTDTEARIVLLEERVEGYVDTIIMECTSQRFVSRLSLFAILDEVAICLRVVAGLEGGFILGIIAGIELFGGVECRTVDTEGYRLQIVQRLWCEQFIDRLCLDGDSGEHHECH